MDRTYQVSYEKKYITGICAGKNYHCHETFVKKSDAIFFSKKDGLQIYDDNGVYVHGFSEITDLTEFLKS